MKKTIKKCLSATLCALLLFAFPLSLTACKEGNPRIVITLTDGRKMTAELYPDIAPQTVARVLTLVDQKLYDGVIFHRVINNFMIQTGGYIPSEQGLMQLSAPGFFGEFYANGFMNELKHEPGVLSMAR
ncbi:MAG: peptidylprolyl isomerase, partial [Clostridia bacterium]|nr:peptidylprolyl isomerase [Clostridia bacterium]